MLKRFSLIGLTVLVAFGSYALSRLHSQALSAAWVPLHVIQQLTAYNKDGSIGDTQVFDTHRFEDGSFVQKITRSADPVGILEITNASTRRGYAIDLV